MLDRMTEGIDVHGKALQLRARRQEVLSSNIANADTPGFKARDFDFASALQAATGRSVARAQPGAQSGSQSGSQSEAQSGAQSGAQPGAQPGARGPAQLATYVSTRSVGLARSQPGHLGAGGSGGGPAATEHSTRMQYVTPEQGTLDGNTVDLNRERAQFADNSLRYEATLRFINGRVRTMLTAIRGE